MNIIRRLLHEGFLLETPGAGSGGGEPPAVVPEPVATPPAEPAAPAGDAPWAADLAALGLDETGLASVDGYLRQKWQPHVTQLEQAATTSRHASELYDDFRQSPLETYLAVGEQLFEENPDALAAIKTALGVTDDEPQVVPTGEPAAPVQDPRLSPMLDSWEKQESDRLWNENIAPYKEKVPHLEDAAFAPFVVASGGDFEQAFEAYQAHESAVAAALESRGWVRPEAPVVPPAPAALGTGSTPSAPIPPPVAKKYTSFDEAFEDTMADMRAAREAPPVV